MCSIKQKALQNNLTLCLKVRKRKRNQIKKRTQNRNRKLRKVNQRIKKSLSATILQKILFQNIS